MHLEIRSTEQRYAPSSNVAVMYSKLVVFVYRTPNGSGHTQFGSELKAGYYACDCTNIRWLIAFI